MKPLNLIGIALLTLTALPAADNVLTKQEHASGWILLFDGKTLTGWDSANPQPPAGPGRGKSGKKGGAPPAQPGAAPAQGSNPLACSAAAADVPAGASHWEVMHGLLVPCGEPAGYLSSTTDYKDFVLQVDFRTGEDTNSGVFVRSPQGIQGYEVQIWKSQPAGYNTGSIVGTGKTDREYKFKADQWNHYEITADGDHLVVVLNGTKTLDVHDSKFSDGRIRLQYQKYPIEFKNIKLKMIQH
jgi:hypothetical protein